MKFGQNGKVDGDDGTAEWLDTALGWGIRANYGGSMATWPVEAVAAIAWVGGGLEVATVSGKRQRVSKANPLVRMKAGAGAGAGADAAGSGDAVVLRVVAEAGGGGGGGGGEP